mgnify:CR=1 FL=1
MAEQWMIEDFEKALRGDLRRYGGEQGIEELPPRDGERHVRRWRIYTSTNSYTISAHPSLTAGAGGYLGCISTCRKPRAGEDWHRGSDLADGPLSSETWHRILADIVSYEMVKVHSREEALKAAEIKAEHFSPEAHGLPALAETSIQWSDVSRETEAAGK